MRGKHVGACGLVLPAVDWEEILRKMASLSDEEFRTELIGVLEGLHQDEGQNLYRRLGELRSGLQVFFKCGA